MSDPTPPTEHIECDCTPDLWESHCHACGEEMQDIVGWRLAEKYHAKAVEVARPMPTDPMPDNVAALIAEAEKISGILEEYVFEDAASNAAGIINSLCDALVAVYAAQKES